MRRLVLTITALLLTQTISAQLAFPRIGDLQDGPSMKELESKAIKWLPLVSSGAVAISYSDFGAGLTYLRIRVFEKDYFGRLFSEDLKSFDIKTSTESDFVYVRNISARSGRITVQGTIRLSDGIEFWDEIGFFDSSNDGIGHATISYWKVDGEYLRTYHYRTGPSWDYFTVVKLSRSVLESIRGREFYGSRVVVELTTSVDEDDGTATYGLNDDRVRLRSYPGLQSKVLRTLNEGERFRILDLDPRGDTVDGHRNYWVKVSVGNVVGWIWGKFIEGLKAN